MRRSLRVGITAALVVIVWAGTWAPVEAVEADRVTGSCGKIVILVEDGADLEAIAGTVRQAGGRVVHIFPGSALIAAGAGDLSHAAGIRAVYKAEVGEATMATLDEEARRAAAVWNQLLAPASPEPISGSVEGLEAQLSHDALTPSAPSMSTMSAQEADPTPGATQTSEFLIGRVAVGVVMTESDGSVDPSTEDWTSEERASVLAEITAALDWWAAREPRANLSFVYDDNGGEPVETSYEPITRPHLDEHLWIAEAMESKGYSGSSYFSQVYAYNNALRETYDTDWAFTVFVVDSSEDDDDLFGDGYFAYAYVGGPFLVMTYGNAGYGIEHMDSVAAHEIGHIFHALDQYEGARQPCTRRAGYLNVENQNSNYGDCASDDRSIMRFHVEPFAEGAVDHYARGQVGWRDSDGDGILDPVDTDISLSGVDFVTDTVETSAYTFTGTIQIEPYPSPARPNVTINTIRSVEYRAGDGGWRAAEPVDADFDSYHESFRFTTDPLPTGKLDVDVRVTDSAGNVNTETLATVSAVNPVDGILDTTLARPDLETAATKETLTYHGRATSDVSFVASTYYRIDDGDWTIVSPDDGTFDEPEETFSFDIALDELTSGQHTLSVYSVDGEGNIEPSPASDTFHNEGGFTRAFLPLVARAP